MRIRIDLLKQVHANYRVEFMIGKRKRVNSITFNQSHMKSGQLVFRQTLRLAHYVGSQKIIESLQKPPSDSDGLDYVRSKDRSISGEIMFSMGRFF